MIIEPKDNYAPYKNFCAVCEEKLPVWNIRETHVKDLMKGNCSKCGKITFMWKHNLKKKG